MEEKRVQFGDLLKSEEPKIQSALAWETIFEKNVYHRELAIPKRELR